MVAPSGKDEEGAGGGGNGVSVVFKVENMLVIEVVLGGWRRCRQQLQTSPNKMSTSSIKYPRMTPCVINDCNVPGCSESSISSPVLTKVQVEAMTAAVSTQES